ncbi:MAG: cysteine synthase A [Candidatus Latescibacterota bacterium]|nr:cysteine synthase A [Candidatus Latescibacterota bacterium]
MSKPRRVDTMLDLIAATPVVRLHRVCSTAGAEVWAKLESQNPGGSLKDRIALAMIEDAEERGDLRPGMTIIESTSGNTGIGLAMVAAVKGYSLIITMPEGVSEERQKLLRAYGAEVILTSAYDGMQGTLDKASELYNEHDGAFMPKQFENPSNPAYHRKKTAQEILDQMEGAPDAFVAGVGTGGTITGVGEVLKETAPETQVIAVEPADSDVLSGGEPGPTEIDGLGAGFVPPVLNRDVLDRIMAITNVDARSMARRLAREEGILAGISSGAVIHAAVEVSTKMSPEQRVLAVVCDTGERYLGGYLFG